MVGEGTQGGADVGRKISDSAFGEGGCYRLNVVSPKMYVHILTPDVRELGGGSLGRCSGHESRALLSGIRALMNGTRGSSRGVRVW